MSRFVNVSDFENWKLKISKTCYQEDDLQACIDKIETIYFQDLVGCALWTLMVAEWDASALPHSFTTQRYIDIYNAFCTDGDCGIERSAGIKEMLIHFIYFEYVRGQAFENRTAGMTKTKSENSDPASPNEHGLFTVYNEGIDTYWTIRKYICDNIATYPEFKGIHKEKTSWL